MSNTTSQSLDSLERKITTQLEAAKSAKTVMIVAYVLLMLIFAGYLSWVRAQILMMTDKKELVRMATYAIGEQIPTVRRAIVAEMRTNGPVLIDQTVDQLIAFIPQGREEVLKTLDLRIKGEADYLQARIEAMLDEGLDANKVEIEAFASTLTTEEGTKAFENLIYDIIAVQLQDPQVTPDIEAYGRVLDGVASRLERLQARDIRDAGDAAEYDLVVALKEISRRSPKMAQVEVPIEGE